MLKLTVFFPSNDVSLFNCKAWLRNHKNIRKLNYQFPHIFLANNNYHWTATYTF